MKSGPAAGAAGPDPVAEAHFNRGSVAGDGRAGRTSAHAGMQPERWSRGHDGAWRIHEPLGQAGKMRITSLVRIVVAALCVLAVPEWASAMQVQPVGAISGQVLEEDTQRPVMGAEVTVSGTRLVGITNEAGRYLITNVPVGTRDVTVQILGYGQMTRSATIQAEQTVTVNFSLRQRAIALEQVVVTGTIGETQRARLPIVVDQVRAADMPVPAVSAGGAIQGKVAGATVINSTGRPGSSPTILLRAPTSINASGRDQEPLYIVDGVILSSSLIDFDALDIDNVEVVKGAAAASLYGSRAQSGVVQITTKRGARVATDQVRYTFRTEMGQSQLGPTPTNLFSTTHPYEVRNGKFVVGSVECDIMLCTGAPNWAGQRRGQSTANTWNSFMTEQYPGAVYDQIDRFFRDGNFVQHYASAEGRTGGTNFHASYSNLDDQGIMRGHQGFKRHNFRLNLDQAVRQDIQLSASAFYSRNEQNTFPEGSGNPIFALTRMPAGVNLFACEDDVTRECLDNPSNLRLLTDVFSRESANPLYEVLNVQRQNERGRFLGSANVRYSPLEWLNVDANVSYDRLDDRSSTIFPKGYRTVSANASFNQGNLGRTIQLTEGMNASLTATTTRRFGDNILNRTQLRYLAEAQEFSGTTTSGSQFAVADIYTFGNIDQTRLSASSFLQPVRADGYFAITNFEISDRYIIDALIRNDGSSLFGADERRHWYYRTAAAWRLGEEPWFNIGGVDEFKLRYSYGTAGGRPNFAAQYETYSVTGGSVLPVNLGNRLLKPEFTREHEVGFDAAILNNRLLLGLTYADAKTTDQILLVPLPAYLGFGNQWRNAGTLAGNTWEASLDARLMSTRDLTWTARLLFDRTRQEITELNVPAYTTGVAGQGMESVFYVRPGEPMGTFYGRQIATNCGHLPAGVDCSQFAVNDDGFLVWVGAGGSLSSPQWGTPGTELIRGVAPMWGAPVVGECEDRVTGERTIFCPLGKGLPDYKVSLSSNLNWRGFTVYGLLDTWQGFQIYNQPLLWTIFKQLGGIMDQTGVPEELQKPVGYYDALYAVNGLAPQSAFIEDGDFVKLRELSVRYRFGADQLGSVPGLNAFSAVTLSLVGRNLVTWSNYRGYDPEAGRGGGTTGSAALARVEGYQYPPFRTFTLGLELNF
jgi:TonB-linked SusC/RagA family outer membrane protein